MTLDDKRTAALGLVQECSDGLRSRTDAASVRQMVMALAARAWQLQGAPADRPYLTRTMSRLAHAVRAHGWVDIASETLAWSIERGAH